MRALRIIGGVLATIIGALALVVGGACAVVLGPDDTVELDSRELTSDGAAVVLSEQLMSYHGPILHVRASGSEPVFLGTAHTTYVQDYLDGVAHRVVHRVTFPPFELDMSNHSGDADRAVRPTTLSWWEDRATGKGEQHLAWPLPAGPYDIVLMRADGATGVELDVRLGIELPGAFAAAVATTLVGAGLLAVPVMVVLVRRSRRRSRRAGEDHLDATAASGRTHSGAGPPGPPPGQGPPPGHGPPGQAPPGQMPGPPPPQGPPPRPPAPSGPSGPTGPPVRPAPPPGPPPTAPPNATPSGYPSRPPGRPNDHPSDRGQR